MLRFLPLLPCLKLPHVTNMWMDLSRRAAKWLTVLSTWYVVWAVPSLLGSQEIASHAVDLPRTGTETSAAPDRVYELLEALQRRHGEPLSGYVGGKVFQNRERRLPRGRYKEYDVNPRVPGRSRDAERLVIEQDTGKAYYSNDHYRTFVPLN